MSLGTSAQQEEQILWQILGLKAGQSSDITTMELFLTSDLRTIITISTKCCEISSGKKEEPSKLKRKTCMLTPISHINAKQSFI